MWLFIKRQALKKRVTPVSKQSLSCLFSPASHTTIRNSPPQPWFAPAITRLQVFGNILNFTHWIELSELGRAWAQTYLDTLVFSAIKYSSLCSTAAFSPHVLCCMEDLLENVGTCRQHCLICLHPVRKHRLCLQLLIRPVVKLINSTMQTCPTWVCPVAPRVPRRGPTCVYQSWNTKAAPGPPRTRKSACWGWRGC